MTREKLSERLKGFATHCSDAGICCYVTGKKEFVIMYFGDPFMFEDEEEIPNGCDSCIMISVNEFDGSEFYEKSIHSFDYSEAVKRYKNNITLAVYDALYYLYKEELAYLNVLPIDIGIPKRVIRC